MEFDLLAEGLHFLYALLLCMVQARPSIRKRLGTSFGMSTQQQVRVPLFQPDVPGIADSDHKALPTRLIIRYAFISSSTRSTAAFV